MDRLKSFLINTIQSIQAHTLQSYRRFKAWIQTRQHPKATLAALITLSIAGIILLIIAYTIINPRPLYTRDYSPFANQQEYQQFIKENPLYQIDSPTNKYFSYKVKILPTKKAVYTFTLYSTPLKPKMSKAYQENYLYRLQKAQIEAQDWLKSQDIDPNKLNIIWSPDPQQIEKAFNRHLTPIPQK